MSRVKKLLPRERERFLEAFESLQAVQRTLAGREGTSVFDRQELHPGYEQLLHHVDRAVRWAEEMQWIIERELSPETRA